MRMTFVGHNTQLRWRLRSNRYDHLDSGAGNAPIAKRSGCLSEANPQGRKGPRVGGLLYLSISNSSTPNSSTRQLYIPFYDAYGNVMGYWDAQGNVVAEYTYDAFGKLIIEKGSDFSV